VPLWIDVKADRVAAPGVRKQKLSVTVTAGSVHAQEVLLVELRVFNFGIPKAQSLPNVWGNSEAAYTATHRKDWRAGPPSYGPKGLSAATDILADHRISVNDIYSIQSSGPTQSNPKPFNETTALG
jgi:hypothetical protein